VTRPRPIPPRPKWTRRPQGSFGWLETRLLHEGTLANLGPETTAVLLLLALAADSRGASYYGRGRMGAMLGMDQAGVEQALDRLREERLVLFRPWRDGCKDGVWQLRPVPERETSRRGQCLQARELLKCLGMDRGMGDQGE